MNTRHLAKWLVREGQEFRITPLGEEKLSAIGIDLEPGQKSRRALARCCVDLTQRRPHLAGILGALLRDLFVQRGWILRAPRSRVVSVTPQGRSALTETLGVVL